MFLITLNVRYHIFQSELDSIENKLNKGLFNMKRLSFT